MGKRKNIENLTDVEKDIINEAMSGRYTMQSAPSKVFDYKIQIKCKNQKQKELLKIIKEKEITFAIGSPGTGKSFISIGAALSLLKDTDNPYDKIIIIMPTCEASSYLSIGFLKGFLDEKIEPYTQADKYTIEKILNLSGNFGSKQITEGLVKHQLIQFELVNFARGKNFDNAIILVSEAENFSKQEMLLILTRIGENSKLIISGDQNQLDRKDIKKSHDDCGLMYAVEHLQELDEVGVVEFSDEDIVRNPLISKIIDAWK